MLATETLYSIRRLRDDARWGSMASWLSFHMVTGLVGPYMVLLHTTMQFRGVAGVAMLLTAIVVASGLVGRYVYTTQGQSTGTRKTLAAWRTLHVPLTWVLFATATFHGLGALYYATMQR